MRTELIGVKLPLHSAMLVRRGAADIGLAKSSYAANLIMRGLESESAEKLPSMTSNLILAIEQFQKCSAQLEQVIGSLNAHLGWANDVELRAFMIETLLILRYLVKSDLKFGGEIGRKLQKAVGDVRVEGT